MCFKPGVRSFSLMVLMIFIFLLSGAGAGLAVEQRGDVIIAIGGSTFNQRGGDPATHTAGTPMLARTVFDSLVYVDHDMNGLPSLAKSWTIAPDWAFIDFFLRDDVTFHNGDKFTAEDAVFSLNTYLRRDLRYLFGSQWRRTITKIEAINPYQVRIHFKLPAPEFMGRLWWSTGIFGKKYRETVGDKGFADKPVGTGPFTWLDYQQDQYWKVKAAKSHFRKVPEISTLAVHYVPEASTRLAMLQSGEADIIAASTNHIPVIKANPKLRLAWSRYASLAAIIFCDLTTPDKPSPFHDIRVREAVSLAIDRKTICEKVLFGSGEPYGEFLSPITLGHDPSIKPDPYDPERARALLREAGYPNGFSTQYSTTTGGKYIAEAIAANLTDVGIKTRVEVLEGGAWISNYFTRKFQGLISKSLWYHAEKHGAADASDDFLNWMPWAYTTTPEIHNAVFEGMRAITDEEIAAAGKRISKEIRESRNRAILWANHIPFGVGPKIEYWEPETGALPPAAYEFIRVKK